jgi:peptidoglycan hydrolase CwlO-like protein
MKLSTATPASISLTTKLVLVFVSILIAVAVPIQIAQRVSADQYDDQINALQQDIDSYNTQATQLATQANTLQSAVAVLKNQVAVIQAQIDLSQAQYDKLVAQIADTEQKIKDNKDALGTTIANMYVDDNITPLEMLASSKSISDYLDKQEYSSSVRDQLTSTIAQIKDLKVQLDKQQADVKVVLDKQQAEKAGLAATQTQQQSLLDQTQGEEAAYQQLVTNNKQKLADVAAQQRAYYQSLLNSSSGGSSGVYGSFEWRNLNPNNGAGGCVDGYPYCQEQDTVVDQWQLYNRECVSYVAWALQYRFGKYVGSFNGYGNAYQWPDSAPLYSGAVRVYNPQPGDAVVLPASGNFAPVGHLMIVESVDGDWMHISQYNMYGTGQYSTMDIRNSGIILLRFPNA